LASSGSFGQQTIGSLISVEVDLDHGGVLGVLVGLQQLRVGQPGLHRLDAALQRAARRRSRRRSCSSSARRC
jgi:hypothetical protein